MAANLAAINQSDLVKAYDAKMNEFSMSSEADKEEVTVIVELESDSVLEQYFMEHNNKGRETFQKYLISNDCKRERNTLLSEQNQFEKKLESDSLIGDIEVLYHYTAIMNGIAIRMKKGDIEALRNKKGVKSAVIAKQYVYTETKADKIEQIEEIKKQVKLSEGYTGKGIAIAVIDTGVDIEHEIFSEEVADGKITKEQVKEVAEKNVLHVNTSNENELYKSSKVPFAYDYADNDCNVCPSKESVFYGNEHGTHVASVAAGNETKSMSGIAKDAQIVALKVFNEERICNDEDILAALEDSVSLDVDIVNMSLGSPAGFSEPESNLISNVYDTVAKAGIHVVVSAGNTYSSANYNGLYGVSLESNPDDGTMNSPASYSSSIAVASVSGGKIKAPYFTVDGRKIAYNEWAHYGQPKLRELESKELEYVKIPNSGEEADYAGLDVTGKIALVSLSAIPFEVQIENAQKAGASAVVIHNILDTPMEVSLSSAVSIPVVIISNEDGKFLLSDKTGKIQINENIESFNEDKAYHESLFSAWGGNSDLTIKPEIAAPGEEVYGALPFQNYGSMTGTSMATPVIAGYFALVKQYVESQEEFSKLTKEEKRKLVVSLLMSTAIPEYDANGVFLSPRKQGSGVANIENALSTKAYLYTEAEMELNGMPKLNLYDDSQKTGSFSGCFHIKNFGKEEKKYQLSYHSLMERVAALSETVHYLQLADEDITEKVKAEILVNGLKSDDSTIVVNGGEDVVVEIKFEFSEQLKTDYDNRFSNGGYFEGYVQLLPNDDQPSLTLPYLGFFGDWTQAPLFDTGDIYNQKAYSQVYHALFTDGGKHLLGINPYDNYMYAFLQNRYNPLWYSMYYENYTLKPDYNKIALSPNGDGLFDSLDLAQVSLLRNAKQLEWRIVDEENQEFYTKQENNVCKTVLSTRTGTQNPLRIEIPFPKCLPASKIENNQTFYLEISGTLDYDRHEATSSGKSLRYPIVIDLEKPTVTKLETEEKKLSFTVADNQYVAYAGIYRNDNENMELLDQKLLNEEEKNKQSNLEFDLSDSLKENEDIKDLSVIVYDYAMNKTEYKVEDLLKQPESSELPVNTNSPVNTNAPVNTPISQATPDPVVTSSIEPVPSVLNKPIGQVTGLKAVAQTTNQIKLKWSKLDKATSYEVYIYSQQAKKYKRAKEVSGRVNQTNISNFEGKKLAPGTVYKIKVRAIRINGSKKQYGKFSSTLYTSTCTKPVKLKEKTKGKKKFLYWEKDNKASGTEVYCSNAYNGSYKKVRTITNSGEARYYCKELEKKKVCYYKVRTYKLVKGKKVNGSFSNVKKIKK